jgi:hypothetical protein
MSPIKQIGRYEIPIGSVLVVEKRTGFWGALFPSYNVTLAGGVVIRLNEAEKAELDEARGFHSKVMEVWGIISDMRAQNRP